MLTRISRSYPRLLSSLTLKRFLRRKSPNQKISAEIEASSANSAISAATLETFSPHLEISSPQPEISENTRDFPLNLPFTSGSTASSLILNSSQNLATWKNSSPLRARSPISDILTSATNFHELTPVSYVTSTRDRYYRKGYEQNQRRGYSTSTEAEAPATPPPIKKTNGNRRVWLPLVILGGAAVLIGSVYVPTLKAQPVGSSRKQDILRLEEIFKKYSTLDEQKGERYMTRADFISAIAMPKIPQDKLERIRASMVEGSTFEKLFGLSGKIGFSEFVFFDALLSTPQNQYQKAFRIFDSDGDGEITKQEFQKLLKSIVQLKFSFTSEYWESFFGPEGKGKISESSFLDIINDLKLGILKLEFTQHDNTDSGYILAKDFAKLIMVNADPNKLPKHIYQHLASVGQAYSDTRISLEDFSGFIRALEFYPDLAKGLRVAKSGQRTISRTEFKRIVEICTGVSLPSHELDVIFHLFDNPKQHGMLDVNSFLQVLESRHDMKLFNRVQLASAFKRRTPLEELVVAVKSFAIGGVAGAIGATAVYPIDLVKTRMQNQRYSTMSGAAAGKQLYTSSIDCFMKVIKNEGPTGLYRGLVPQLIGVAPEKAIKLVVNDFLRYQFQSNAEGDVQFLFEVIAGGTAGGSQVVFTNPIEIIKIRLQVQGELASQYGVKPKGAVTIIRELGFLGLYKGASACFMRDIPFSAIYFPSYAHFKEMLKDDKGNLQPKDLLIAGSLSGLISASSTTPADVIKTRLQVEARKGDQTYNGIVDCAVKVFKAEGPLAFFKGIVPRCFRSSPQFGVTLLSYEMLQKWFDPNREISPAPPTNAPVAPEDLSTPDKQKMMRTWGLTPV